MWWLAPFLAIFAALYIRKHPHLLERAVPYRGSLVPPDFWKTCLPPSEPPLVVWIAERWSRYPQEISEALVKGGWSVVAILPKGVATDMAEPTEIPILNFHQRTSIEIIIRRANYILGLGKKVEDVAAATAKNSRKPYCRVVIEPSTQSSYPEIAPAAWLQPSALTVHPPFYMKAHQTHTDRVYITSIGNRGSAEFYGLARKFPQWQFMIVGPPSAPPKLPNLRVVRSQKDLRGIFSKTGILVWLDREEIWPRAALEAAASGIPTVGLASAGFEEAMGENGLKSMEEIADRLEELKGSIVAYETASRAALAVASSAVNSKEELERLRLFLRTL